MKNKIKLIIKILCPFFITITFLLGFLTNSNQQKQLELNTKPNLAYSKINNKNLNSLNTTKLSGTIIQTSISDYTSSALVMDKNFKTHLYMWGSNSNGQQGNGDGKDNVTTPKEVKNLNNFLKNGSFITQISMSNDTSSALIKYKDGQTSLYMWGLNDKGQQGDTKTDTVKTPKKVKFNNLPKGSEIIKISMSSSTSSALIKYPDGKTHLYMWGSNNYSQQGDGTHNNVSTPSEVLKLTNFLKNGEKISEIFMSEETSSVLIENKGVNSLFMWGGNDFSQQGDGTTNEVTTPKKVESLNDLLVDGSRLVKISMSDLTSSSLIIDKGGVYHFYMWGQNSYYQQGDGTNSVVSKPKEVDKDKKIWKKESKIINISVSDKTSSATVANSNGEIKLYMWGLNDHGQQGDGGQGHEKDIKKPTEVKSLVDVFSPEKEVTQVLISTLTSSLTILDCKEECTYFYMWGSNSNGQQGDVKIRNVFYPRKVLIAKIKNNEKKESNFNYLVIILIVIFALILMLFLFLWFINKKPKKLLKNN